MTVQELMDTLKDLDPDMEVYLQADAEGNGYGECAGAEPAMWSKDRGECIHADDVEDAEENDEELSEVLVLWPV